MRRRGVTTNRAQSAAGETTHTKGTPLAAASAAKREGSDDGSADGASDSDDDIDEFIASDGEAEVIYLT